MSIIKRTLLRSSNFWECLWFRPFDPLPMALFRISSGVLMLVMYLCLYPNWNRYFALDGVLSLTGRPYPDWWCVFNYTETFFPIRVWWCIGFLGTIAFIAGWRTRAVTILLYVIQIGMIHRNRFAINGEDLVFRMLLFYGCFAPLGRSLSVDAWTEKRALSAPPQAPWPSVWPLRLMQINFALIYAISLPNKLVDDVAWLNGDAVYLSLVSNLWSRGIGVSFFYGGYLSQMLTYGTLLAEGLFPFLVWSRRWRPFVLVAVAGLHIGIAVFLKNVTFFSLSMVCSLSLFVTASEIRRAWAWLEKLWLSLKG